MKLLAVSIVVILTALLCVGLAAYYIVVGHLPMALAYTALVGLAWLTLDKIVRLNP